MTTAPGVMACATCMGSPESPLTRGLSLGILSLLGIVWMVLGGAIAFFVFIARRASAVRSMEVAAGSKQGESIGKAE